MDITVLLKEHAIDIFAFAIFILMMLIGAKRGFLRTLAEFACSLLAFTAAKLLATPAATFAYNTFYQARALSLVNSVFTGTGNSAADVIGKVLDALPGGVGEYARASGLVSGESITNAIQNNIVSAAEIETNIIRPIAEQLLRIALFACLSLLIGTVLRIIVRIVIHAVRKGAVVKASDTVLGIVIGGLKGLLAAFIFGAVTIFLSYASPAMAAYTANSYICLAVKAVIGL